MEHLLSVLILAIFKNNFSRIDAENCVHSFVSSVRLELQLVCFFLYKTCFLAHSVFPFSMDSSSNYTHTCETLKILSIIEQGMEKDCQSSKLWPS